MTQSQGNTPGLSGSLKIPINSAYKAVKASFKTLQLISLMPEALLIYIPLRIETGDRMGYAVLEIKMLFLRKYTPYNSKI